ncbi:MAG: hypothetical protein HeimC2_04460 [Candidatus Heimdallarchaeota archaeon LC_2]|nr:MAG: hypothetical protein HeimC2_04460 [Candidatus Heimdallarchaeota archaeon LC_2]
MIHKLIIFNTKTLDGIQIFDRSDVHLNVDLIVRLVAAMGIMSENLGDSKGEISEIELGTYQIGIFTVDTLAYVVLQDKFDNEPFTSKILNNIVDLFHEQLIEVSNNLEIDRKLKSEIATYLETMKFPDVLISEVNKLAETFQFDTLGACDVLFLADLDDGIVTTFANADDQKISNLLMEILSEIPFEKSWIAEMKSKQEMNEEKRSHEFWVISRIGMTDFTILARGFYQPFIDKNNIINKLECLCKDIHQLLMQDTYVW